MDGAGSKRDSPLVLALHGQGMNQDVLARLLGGLFSLPLRFLIPTAPPLAQRSSDSRPSWYHYDGNQQRFRSELDRVENLLLRFQGEVEREKSLAPRTRILFGFSQGGYCGSYVALRNPDRFNGMIVSGARVKTEFLGDAIRRAGQMGFASLHCHGRRDFAVRVDAAESSWRQLDAGGVHATWKVFESGHSIGRAQIDIIREWLVSHLGLA
jgi:predicted esterase